MKGLVKMGVELISRGKVLCAKLSGDIDHHGAKELRRDIDIAIEENCPSELILDFSAVTFMDSSGIGLVMGRIGKVMRVSGVGKLARIVNDYTLPREDEQEVMKIETTNQ